MILSDQGHGKETKAGFWGYRLLSDAQKKELVDRAQIRVNQDLQEQALCPLNIQPGRSLNFREQMVIKVKRILRRL